MCVYPSCEVYSVTDCRSSVCSCYPGVAWDNISYFCLSLTSASFASCPAAAWLLFRNGQSVKLMNACSSLMNTLSIKILKDFKLLYLYLQLPLAHTAQYTLQPAYVTWCWCWCYKWVVKIMIWAILVVICVLFFRLPQACGPNTQFRI